MYSLIDMPKNSTNSNNGKRRKNRQSSSYSLTNRARMTLHTGFPARYRTAVKCEMQCYIPSGNATAAAGNYFSLVANSLYIPYTSTYNMTTGTGTAAFAFNGTLTNGYSIANSSMFYTELATIYAQYKVLRYSLKVTARSTSVADVFNLCLFPIGIQPIPAAGAGSVNMRVFGTQPRSVQKEIGTGMSSTSLVLSQDVNDLLEIRKSQWLDMPSTQMTAQPAGTGTESFLGFVGVFLQMLSGANNTGAISVTAELTQEVECTDLLQPIN